MKILERFWFSCGHCHEGDGCPVAEAAEKGELEFGPLSQGLPLVVTAIAVFLLPLTLAILGAWFVGMRTELHAGMSTSMAQGIGAAVGLLVGVGIAKIVATVVISKYERRQDSHS